MWDLTDVKEDSFEALPTGNYLVKCEEAEVKTTKAGNGSYINLTLKILNGEAEGRKVFATFNVENPNAEAVEIGRKQLKGYMKACGFTDFNLKGVNELVGSPVVAHIKQEERDGIVRNKVSYFKASVKGDLAPF